MLESTSWTTKDAMAMMAGGPAVEQTKSGVERVHTEWFLRQWRVN